LALREVVWVNFDARITFLPCFLGEIGLPARGKTCNDAPMAKLKRLLDIYRFPGFAPRPTVRGIFGDPLAVVVTLARRRKKRAVAFADMLLSPTTTNGHAASATWPVATSVSISISKCEGFLAPSVAV
jgi:hypothetical protein